MICVAIKSFDALNIEMMNEQAQNYMVFPMPLFDKASISLCISKAAASIECEDSLLEPTPMDLWSRVSVIIKCQGDDYYLSPI